MQCPKCDTGVAPVAAECPACGVILTKAAPRFVPPHWTPIVAQRTKPPARSSSSTLIKLAVAILGVWFGWHLLAPKLAAYRAESIDGAAKTPNGFVSVIMPEGASKNTVMIFAPLNCPSAGAQRADALASELTGRGIPNVRSDTYRF